MGKPRNTRKYPTYPEIPEIPGNTRKKKDTRKYPIVFFDTPTRPATRYFVQYPTRPDIEKLYPLGTGCKAATIRAALVLPPEAICFCFYTRPHLFTTVE